MALVLPSPVELGKHKDGPDDETAIRWAADLFTLATGITDSPLVPMEVRLIKLAIMDMAWYLQTNHDDREAEFSPFSSERIGSYSYTKMVQAAQNKVGTGVAAFDSAVAHFVGNQTIISSSTEWVFKPGYDRPNITVWDRPLVHVLDGGNIDFDQWGNPIVEGD